MRCWSIRWNPPEARSPSASASRSSRLQCAPNQSRSRRAAALQPVDLPCVAGGARRNPLGYAVSDLADGADRGSRRRYRAAMEARCASPSPDDSFRGSRRSVRCRASSISRAAGSRSISITSARFDFRRRLPMRFRGIVGRTTYCLRVPRHPSEHPRGGVSNVCRGVQRPRRPTRAQSRRRARRAAGGESPGITISCELRAAGKASGAGPLTLTHAGLNTVLDSLAHGVPLVTMPITYEQPAIAKRVEWHRCGESLTLSNLNARRVREALMRVFENTSYREAAARMSAAIGAAGGVVRATSLVESAVK